MTSKGTFGIYMGCVGAAIATLRNGEPELVRNNENEEITPSAVWIRDNHLIVGRKAVQRLFVDSENAHGDFLLRMGTSEEFSFRRSGRRMRAEELSAEVLKSLRADVKQRLGEDVEAAVITVPVDFDLPQIEATNKAARLAGLQRSSLLHEMAAIAEYLGLRDEPEGPVWVISHFGTGMFEIALVRLSSGEVDVLHSGGDNQLGWKLIDWAIVDQLLAPAVAKQYALPDFRRGNPRWVSAFAKLKLKAEAARSYLWAEDSADIYIDPLFKDERDHDVSFEFDLKRQDVIELARPFIDRAIGICRRVLKEANLKEGMIRKSILLSSDAAGIVWDEQFLDLAAGGPGIPRERVTDPHLALAGGAALYAGRMDWKIEH